MKKLRPHVKTGESSLSLINVDFNKRHVLPSVPLSLAAACGRRAAVANLRRLVPRPQANQDTYCRLGLHEERRRGLKAILKVLMVSNGPLVISTCAPCESVSNLLTC